MKKILSILFLLTLFAPVSKAMTYEDGLKSSKPMAILIYADWADDLDKVMATYNAMQAKYDKDFNFVPLNIASKDTKIYNQKYHIYPNLPYVILSRDNGKITRYLQKSCAMDSSCFTERINFFTR